MTLLIANANHDLDDLPDKIKSAYNRANKTAEKLLGLTDINVICISDASMVIPEIGTGGYTPSRHLTYLYIDPESNIDENEIYNTLCHELHHAKRYDDIGYGKTLLDSMIFEGLAVAFEEEISGKGAFMPSQLLVRKDTSVLLRKIRHKLDHEDFEHFRWFIYDNPEELPRWTGYEVGYYLIRQYLQLHPNKKASELVLDASVSFI